MFQTNKDLIRERNQASFDPNEITHLIDGGPDKTKTRRDLEHIIFNEPEFKDAWKMVFKSKSEAYEDAVAKSAKLIKLQNKHQWTFEQSDYVRMNVRHVLDVHFTMFVPALERLATSTQRDKWSPLAKNFQIIGTYAQTEMGHGTYLPGLETTATYDPVTEEFVLNTPSRSAMKWWPGGLGKSVTHAIVLATLMINKSNCGMHPFIVQLRSLDNHMPLPGIEVGDIGPKFVMNYGDNGYLILNNVRIPRENMLMKNAQVSKDGRFISSGVNRANYATMTYVRVHITDVAYKLLNSTITIAIRYSAVRHQSKLSDSEPEPQVLDYQTQQYKLFPLLADAYALFFVSKRLGQQYNKMMDNITRKGNFKMLPEIHGISCGLKALSTQMLIKATNTCRSACGGHGFLGVSQLPAAIGAAHALHTVEGEYTVVCLQTARYLIKQIAKVAGGTIVENTSEYLNTDPQSYTCPIQNPADCLNLKYLIDIFQNRSNSLIRQVANKLQKDIESGISQHEAMNKNLQSLVRIAKAHCQVIMLADFVAGVTALKTSQGTINILTKLCQLHALHSVVENSGEFLETESLGLVQMDWIREQELNLLPAIRPDAVALVDAFDVHDDIHGSLLGAYDGNVYERLYESAKYNPMNKTQVHPSFNKYLKPLMGTTSKL